MLQQSWERCDKEKEESAARTAKKKKAKKEQAAQVKGEEEGHVVDDETEPVSHRAAHALAFLRWGMKERTRGTRAQQEWRTYLPQRP